MPLRLKGMIFDLDGTLGDTLPVCFAAFRETFRAYLGKKYSDAEIRALFGPAEEGILRNLVPDRWQESLQRYLSEYAKAHEQCREPFPGISAALRLLRERQIKLAIVTGKGPGSAEISLQAMGLAGAFDAVEAGSANGGVKPASMRRVLESWGFEPPQVATLGDAPSDIRAGREIGALPLGAAWAETSDFAALDGLQPLATFRTVPQFIQWIEEHVEA